MPPFECFVKKEKDVSFRSKYVHATLSTLKKCDLVYCVVTNKSSAGIIVKPLCTGNQTFKILEDLNLKVISFKYFILSFKVCDNRTSSKLQFWK